MEAAEAGSDRSPRVGPSRYAIYFGGLFAGCSVDLLTKEWVFRKYFRPEGGPSEPHWWIEPWFGIETSINQGALFGMGQGNSGWFALMSFAALAGIMFWLFVRRGAMDLWLTITLAAISGGIVGNLYDRLGLWHGGSRHAWNGFEIGQTGLYGVRDWIHFRWEGAPLAIFDPWPNFNIADSLLVCGACALFVHALFARPVESDEKSAAANQAGSKSGAQSDSNPQRAASSSATPAS